MSINKIGKGKIEIVFDEDSQELSTSGKSYLLGSSHGYVPIGDGISINYNIIKK